MISKSVITAVLCLLITSATLGQGGRSDMTAADYKRLSIEDLMEIEVTSVSKRPERLLESASAVQIITADDIRRSGVTTLPEALKLASNLQVAQVNASQWAISARGFNNVLANKLLVLVDGRVVYTPLYAGVFWDVQNVVLEDVDRIEVISGPGGTLWGANAVNGVINIITKSSTDTQGLYVEALAGTEMKGLGSIRYGGKISEAVTYRIHGTAFKRDNTIFPDSVDAQDDWHIAQGGLRVDWKMDDKSNLAFIGNYTNGRPNPDGSKPTVVKGVNFLSRWNRTISDRSDVQIQAYYDQTWRAFGNGFAEYLVTYDVEAQHRFDLGSRHEMVYGAGFRSLHHSVDNLETFAFQPAQRSLYLFNVFVQDNISLIPEKLKLTPGIKVEHYTYTDFQFQPNVRLSWHPSSHQTVWGAVSRAIKNPSRIDREFFLYLAPNVPVIIGNDAKPEELLAYELGWHYRPADRLSFSLATYYNKYDNIRGVEPAIDDVAIPLIFANVVQGDSYGAELSFTYQVLPTWRLRGGYNYFSKDLSVKPGRIDRNNATAESNDPHSQAMLQSMLDVGEQVDLGFLVRYVGTAPFPEIKEYVGLDVRFAYRPVEKIELSVVGQNLLQNNHIEFIPDSPEAKAIERSFYFKVTGRF